LYCYKKISTASTTHEHKKQHKGSNAAFLMGLEAEETTRQDQWLRQCFESPDTAGRVTGLGILPVEICASRHQSSSSGTSGGRNLRKTSSPRLTCKMSVIAEVGRYVFHQATQADSASYLNRMGNKQQPK